MYCDDDKEGEPVQAWPCKLGGKCLHADCDRRVTGRTRVLRPKDGRRGYAFVGYYRAEPRGVVNEWGAYLGPLLAGDVFVRERPVMSQAAE